MEPDAQDCWPRRKSFAEPLRLEDSTVMAEWIVRLGVDEASIHAAAARVGSMPAALEAYFLSTKASRPVPPGQQVELELRFLNRKKRLSSR